MITWRFAGYLLLIGLSIIMLALFQIDLLLVLLILLVLLPILSAFQLLIARSSLQVTQELDPPVTERGDPVQLVVRLFQNSWLSHGEIVLFARKQEGKGRMSYQQKRIPLPGREAAVLPFHMATPHRGLYEAGLNRVMSRDLFGLFYLVMLNHKKCREIVRSLTVLPKPAEIAGLDIVTSRLAGSEERQVPQIGDEVDDIANLRGRRPDESMKRIHWKVSARLDKLMIKEFENPIRKEGLIILDMARPGQQISKIHDYTDLADFFTDRAAFLARFLVESHIGSKIVCYQEDNRLAVKIENQDHLRQLQMILADMKWTDLCAADQVISAEAGSPDQYWFIILVATRIGIETARRLAALQAMGMAAFLILLQEKQAAGHEQEAGLDILAGGDVPTIQLSRISG